jgi:hypothetical protein
VGQFGDDVTGSKKTRERSLRHGSFSLGGRGGINSLSCARINEIEDDEYKFLRINFINSSYLTSFVEALVKRSYIFNNIDFISALDKGLFSEEFVPLNN